MQRIAAFFASAFVCFGAYAQSTTSAAPDSALATNTTPTNTVVQAPPANLTCSTLSEEGQPACGQEAGNPINVTNGNKFQREVDMPALPGVLGLELIRHYNSAASRLQDAPTMFGRGWRLSYDWALRLDHASQNASIILVRGDGTQIALLKNRPGRQSPTPRLSWRAVGAEQGRLTEHRKPLDNEYLWTEPTGRRYRFSAKGWLIGIEAPTGELLSIERERKGDITKVTDPQGRTLVMSLLSDEVALRSNRFGGVQAVDTPVGRYQYRYGGTLAQGSRIDPNRILSRLISMEHAGIKRHYLFEDAQQVSLLTGIRVEGAGSDGVAMNQRIATWAYDSQGRAVMSMKGDQERVTLSFLPKLNGSNKGPEKSAQNVVTGTTLLSNSFGAKTLYRYQWIAGRPHLTEVLGPGCASCGPTNLRHEYDSSGRVLQTTYLAPATIRVARAGKTANTMVEHGIRAGQALRATRISYDPWGRPTQRFEIDYQDGLSGSPRLVMRYEYLAPSGDDQNPNPKPTLIARPSVVPGKEHRLDVSYNEYGQITQMSESGFDPQAGQEISRTKRFAYQLIQGRSVLVQADGPLANGPKQSPVDSDITTYQWDSKADQVLAIVSPHGLVQRRNYDDAGRTASLIVDDGVRRLQQDLSYSKDGRYALTLDKTLTSGAVLTPGAQTRALDQQTLPSARHLYDALGRLSQSMDGAGRTITREYDAANRPRSVADRQGNRSVTDFDTEGRPRAAGLYRAANKDPLRAAYFWHDEEGRPTKRVLADGRIDTWRYADAGHLVEHIDGDDIKTTMLQAKSLPNGGVGQRGASHRGASHRAVTQQAFVQEMQAHEAKLQPSIVQQVMVQQAVDGDLRFRWQSNSPGAERSQVFDDFGRVVKTRLADHGDRQAIYDAGNRLIKLTQADQCSVHYRYDLSGRLIQKHYEDATGKNQGETLLIYEGALLKSVIDPEQTTQFHYDSLGRKTGESVQIKGLAQSFSTTQSYDPITGLLSERGLFNGQVLLISRDSVAMGANANALRLRSSGAAWLVKHAQSLLPTAVSEKLLKYLPVEILADNIQIDPFDGLKAFQSGNGINIKRSFDIAGRMTSQTVDNLGTTHYEYQIGPRIRALEKRQNLNESQSIVQASSAAPLLRTAYNYSGFGAMLPIASQSANLTKVAQANISGGLPGASPTRTDARSDLASTPPSPTLAVQAVRDDLGRLIVDGRHRYSYQPRGQIAEVRDRQSNRVIASYRYDSQGHRIAKTVYAFSGGAGFKEEAKTTYFLWQDNRVVAEIDESGKVNSQYFYLNSSDSVETSRPTPIAKWESKSNPLNPSKEDRLLFIHADHRGAPFAMTDASQAVIWGIDERENLWGAAKAPGQLISVAHTDESRAKLSPGAQGASRLNLRLPGQYFDEETGLHDNFNRTYDPSIGRYLQPDPLGYPDGPDAYLYASGDPMNRIDPLGLYQVDVHYYMTYFLATTLGMSSQDAQTLASASQYIDDNSKTWPLGDKFLNTNPSTQEQRLSRYHFTMYKRVQTGPRSVSLIYSTDSNLLNGLQNSEQLQLLRGYAMPPSNTGCALPTDQSLQFMGEFLHSFEDTFSHRDQNNVPIPLNAGFGHALHGENPDYTYNHDVPVYDPSTGMRVNTIHWQVNEDRTLAMEAMVYKQILEFMINRNYYVSGAAQKSKIVPFEKLLPTLKRFNATKEGGSVSFAEKREILRGFLSLEGLGARIPDYDKNMACANRKANLSGLNRKDYTAAILGQDC